MASSTSCNSIAVCSTSTPYLTARRLSCSSFPTSRVPCCPTSISLTSYELTIYFKRRWQSCKRGRFVFLATMRNTQYNDLNERSVDSSPTVRSDVTSKYNPASFKDKSETRETELQCVGTGSNVDCVVSESNSDPAVGNVASPASSVSDQKMPYEFINQERATNMECIGTGTDVECVIPDSTSSNRIASRAVTDPQTRRASTYALSDSSEAGLLGDDGENQRQKLPFFLSDIWESLVLISPFFFWGTAMVAMKGVLPKAGPLFVAATRLIPSGLLLVSFAGFRGRKQPSGLNAWLAITLFALVDAACFQGFLAEGLKRTSAGLGSVIIDSQPLTVAVLASILFGETIGALGVLGLATGILGLLLLEVPTQLIENFLHAHGLNSLGPSVTTSTAANGWTIWDSGEWWMLLAAQSMAIGTVMVRWICQFADPVMATGWHMVLGGIPLLALASIQHDPALAGHIQDLELVDWLALVYTSVFGSAVSYGVFFYNASRGSLTKLSSLTFLTPMFAAFFGYLFLDETLNPTQLVGACVTLGSIYLINIKNTSIDESDAM